ncbi:hypothetical protein PMIN03_009028 [Paraphaeosphaeria minitans]
MSESEDSEMQDVGDFNGHGSTEIEAYYNLPFQDQCVLQWRKTVVRGELNAPYPVFEDQNTATEDGGTQFGSQTTLSGDGRTVGAEEDMSDAEENSTDDSSVGDGDKSLASYEYETDVNTASDFDDNSSSTSSSSATVIALMRKKAPRKSAILASQKIAKINLAYGSDKTSLSSITSSSTPASTVIVPTRKTGARKNATRKVVEKDIADDTGTSSLSSTPSSLSSPSTVVVPVDKKVPSISETTNSKPVVAPVRKKGPTRIVQLKKFKRKQAEARAVRSRNPSPERRPDAENSGFHLFIDYDGFSESETRTESTWESGNGSEYEPDEDEEMGDDDDE